MAALEHRYCTQSQSRGNKIQELLVQRTNSPLTQTFFWLIMQSSLNKWQEEMCDEALSMSVLEGLRTNQNSSFFFSSPTYITGADQGLFLGGGALISCSTSTPINHIVFFFCRIPVVLENCRSSQGGAHPLHPPPRSTPDKILTICRQWGSWWIRRRPKII